MYRSDQLIIHAPVAGYEVCLCKYFLNAKMRDEWEGLRKGLDI